VRLVIADTSPINYLLLIVIAARTKGLEVTGTVGVLSRAAQLRFLDLREAFDRIKRTNFRCRQEVMDEFLSRMDKTGIA
jgi:predicted nucleic acid-binding protein